MKKIKVSKNGPYVIEDSVALYEERVISDKNNDPIEWQKTKKYPPKKKYLLCRCGKSNNKPYCDNSHLQSDFDGTESKTARKKYAELEEVTSGPINNLHDAAELCAGVGFCYRKGGTWALIKKDSQELVEIAVEQCCNCPSGRLVAEDHERGVIEPEFKQEISVIQETDRGVSGPLWVKGGVEIESADGEKYEKRNRVTLCRCGKSNNKPFCDGMHHFAKFKDKQ